MFSYENEPLLVQDREDLIAILRMRFGTVTPETVEAIYQIDSLSALERLILAAANARDLKTFLEELGESTDSFRLVGERFNPVETFTTRGDDNGEKR